MASHWVTGKYIIEHYDILDFELNNLIRYGLDAYEPSTGYKYVDNTPHKERQNKPITTTEKGSNNNAMRINFKPRKKLRLITNKQIDIRDYNGLDEEVVTNIPPTNCRPVSFIIPDNQEEIDKFFLRNRRAIFRSIDVERAMLLYNITPIENELHQQRNRTQQENNDQNLCQQETTTECLSTLERQGDENKIPQLDGNSIKKIGRKKTLPDSECIKIYLQHYRDEKTLAFLAKSYPWETSPFADKPKPETAKDRIKKAINRGRELIPTRQRPESDKKGQ
jgi:hypothetical protein